MKGLFGESKSDLKAQIANLQAVSNSRGKKIETLEKQIQNRTGVESLDPEGVLALLSYRESEPWPEGSRRDFSILKNILNYRFARDIEVYECTDGSVLLYGDLYRIPVENVDTPTADEAEPGSDTESEPPQVTSGIYRIVAYDVLLPATIRYGNLSQISTVLSPMRFEDLGRILDIEDEFFVLPGKLEFDTDEDGTERTRIVLLPPEAESVIVITGSGMEERRIDFATYKAMVERQIGSTLTSEDLKIQEEYYSEIKESYIYEWYAPLDDLKFISPGAKD